jgi:alcohol dehydrogenase
VLVLGGGAIGILAALLLMRYGVRDITVAERNVLRRRAVAAETNARVYDPVTDSAPSDSSVDLVLDAVGAASTRTAALRAVKPGGVVVHVGLQGWASEIDMRKLTLAEITLIGTYTYSTADLRAAVRALHEGAFGNLGWVEERPLAEGAAAFRDLHEGRCAAAKIVLRP